MTRKEVLELFEMVFGRGLHAAVIVFRSSLTDKLEERHIYADDFMEIDLWVTEISKHYSSLNVPFVIWVNNHIEIANVTTLFNEEECNDD